MADFIFKISPNIMLGSYLTARLGQFVKEWGTKYMLILDPDLQDFDIGDKIQNSLTERKIDFFVFNDIPVTPDSTDIERALKLAREAHIHGVIVAGSTKTANIARAVCALYNEVHDLYDYMDGASPTSAPLPLINIPTAMQDSFLFTDRTPIIDARNRKTKLLKIQNGLCKLALFDPNLSINMTDSQIASNSIQTLCVAIESYISQKSNFFSDTILEKAIELLANGFDGSPSLTGSASSEILLAQGGCMTSLGAAISSTGPASLLALTIDSRFQVTSSLTAGILLPYVIEDVAKYKSDKLANVARIMRIADPNTDTKTAVNALSENIRNRLALANLPARLKDLSVSIEQLALAAEDAGQLDLINGLPRSMNADDLFDLIKQAY